MTSYEFHKALGEAVKKSDAKAIGVLCEKFVQELSLDISKTIVNKCTALTGGMVAEMLRRYATEVEENTDAEGKLLSAVVFAGSKQSVYRMQVPLGAGEEK